MDKLLPCPFCGSDGKMVSVDSRSWWVECRGCEVEGRSQHLEDDAIAAWNRRAANAAPAPALLALAIFGARVLQAGLSPAGFVVGLTGSAIGGAGEAARAIVYDKDDMARMAPGIASAIVALLEPDQHEGVTDGD